MHIKIPIGYTAEVVELGKRKEQTVNFFEWINVTIANPSSSEAPVAIAWREEQPVAGDRYQARYDQCQKYAEMGVTPADGFQHTRWFEDAHWWPILRKVEAEDRISRGKRLTIEEYQAEWLNDMSGYPLGRAGVNYNTGKDYPDGRPLDLDQYRSVKNSTREARIESFIDDIKQLIVVDGIVYQRLPEPVYVVGLNSYVDHDNQCVLRILPNDPAKLPDKLHFWTMDRFDEAHEYALTRNFNGERSNRESLNIEREAIVHIPESLKTDMDIQGMIADGEVIVKADSETSMRKFSKAQAIGYVNFREAYTEFLNDKDPEPLHAAAVDYLKTVSENSSTVKARLKSLIGRHEMRPIKGYGVQR